MSVVAIADPRATTRPSAVAGRWMLGFLGFPIGGLLAMATVGSIDSSASALVGGAITGLVLGTAQSLASPALPRMRWVVATTMGLSVGLAIGANAVDFATSTGALAWQGAICGAVIGLAQAVVLARFTRIGSGRALSWIPLLAGSWALGWTITASAGVDVERQYTVFGASGALAVTALTVVLPLAVRRRPITTEV